MEVFLITFAFLGCGILLLSVGFIVGKKELQGSCGAAKKIATLDDGVEIDVDCDSCAARREDSEDCALKVSN